MQIRASAIIVAVRSHGETGAIIRALTANHGLLAGYVRGGRSRRIRPILGVGNVVDANFIVRSEAQLASLSIEPVLSRAALSAEPLAAAAVEWVTALAAVSLPEAHPYPGIYATLGAILVAIESAPSARGWVPALVQYEALILAELGYGSGATTLAETGKRLRDDLLIGRRADILPARDRLIDRINRAMGR